MINNALLKQVTLFNRLKDEILDQIAARLQMHALREGEVLFNMGDPGNDLVIVQTGCVAIYVPNSEKSGKEQPIRIFRAGEALGEMALIDGRPRSLSARALEASDILLLTGDDFRALLAQSPALSLAVMGGLSDRIRYTTEFLAEVQEWVKRVAEGKYERQFAPNRDYKDRSMQDLAAEFAQMAAQVQKREEELRQEVIQLRIEINETKRQREVEQIVDTDYFRDLQNRAKKLRE